MDSKQTYGMLSFAFYWAWLFVAIVGPSLLHATDTTGSLFIRLAGAAGIAAGLAVQYALMPKISIYDSRLFAAVCAIFPFAYSAALLLPGAEMSVPWLLGLLLFLAGAASSLVLCGIGGGFSGYPRRYAITATCLASAIGALIAVLLSSAPWAASVAASGLLMPVSSILYRKAGLVPNPETAESRRRAFDVMRGYHSLLVFMFLYSALFGVVIVQGAFMEPAGVGVSPILLTICAPGVIMLVLLASTKIRVDVESLQRLFLALAIIGMAPLAFLSSDAGFYFLLLLTVIFGMFDISNFVTLFEIIRENELPKLETFAIGRLLSELGIAVGWGLGLAVTGIAGENSNTAILVVEAATVALIVLGLALLGRDAQSEDSELDEKSPAAGLPQEQPDPYAYRARAVSSLEDEFDLSPREREVFEMLASGRSPKRISEKLFVSESTAKSHCYRIYQKVGVHSQQDLLDVIDDQVAAIHNDQWTLMP